MMCLLLLFFSFYKQLVYAATATRADTNVPPSFVGRNQRQRTHISLHARPGWIAVRCCRHSAPTKPISQFTACTRADGADLRVQRAAVHDGVIPAAAVPAVVVQVKIAGVVGKSVRDPDNWLFLRIHSPTRWAEERRAS